MVARVVRLLISLTGARGTYSTCALTSNPEGRLDTDWKAPNVGICEQRLR